MSDYIDPPTTLPPGSKVWAYLRDSGGDAQEQSVQQQQREIEAYCRKHGLALIRTFADIAKSGGHVEKRDAFLEMIDLSYYPEARPAGLLLWNHARFSRDLDDSSYYKSTLRKNNIVVHSMTDPIPEGPFGRVIETIIDIANEDKRRQTSRDVKRALQALFREGYSFGVPPRGYIVERVEVGRKRNGEARIAGKWIPDPALWDIVKLSWELRAQGKSYREIQAATHNLLYKSINCWPTFFRNKAYLGIGEWGELEIPNHHQAAIDWAIWEKVCIVQKERHSPRAGLSHPRTMGTATPALLTGLAVCAYCGRVMVKESAGKNKWPCYQCNKKNVQGGAACPNRMVSERAADQAVIDAVLNQVLTHEYIASLLEETRAQLTQENFDQEEANLKKQLGECKRAIENLLDLAETGSKGLRERLQERERERAYIEATLQQIAHKKRAATVELSEEALLIAIHTWRDAIITTRKAEDIRALKNLLTRFVSKVELSYNHARIWYTYPIENFQTYTDNNIIASGGTFLLPCKMLEVCWSKKHVLHDDL